MEFQDLYQEVMLDHYRKPRNFAAIEGEGFRVEFDNPVCGEHSKLILGVSDEETIQYLKFKGHGINDDRGGEGKIGGPGKEDHQ